MIHKLTLRNFKGIESANLSFERFTVLVGPNASGKTSVLQALDLLSAFADPDTMRAEVIPEYGGLSAIKRGSQTDLLIEKKCAGRTHLWNNSRSGVRPPVSRTSSERSASGSSPCGPDSRA